MPHAYPHWSQAHTLVKFAGNGFQEVQIHKQGHYKHKIHSCCVCGRLYFNLQLFIAHCRLHAECEYMKVSSIAAKESEAHIKKKLQIVQNTDPVSVCAEQIALSGCVKVEEVDTHTGGGCDGNSVCSPHHQAISVSNTEVTSISDDATASSTSHSSSCDAQLIVSIKLPLQTV